MCATVHTVRHSLKKALLGLLVLCIVSMFAASASAQSAAQQIYQEQFLQLINMERSREGVPALNVGSDALNAAAMARAEELTVRYSYVRPNGQREFTILPEYGIEDPSVGETYWAGSATPEQTVEAWMQNDYFRARILDKNAENIGVGFYEGGEYGNYWVVIFTYPEHSNEDEFAQQVLALVNNERTQRGLTALVLGDEKLSAATALRAREIAEVNSHTRPDGTSCFTVLEQYEITDEAIGENAAWGSVSPEEVVRDWMNSQGHREILLDAAARKMCVSCYYDANSTYGTNWDMLLTK